MKISRLLQLASAGFFFASAALAQTAGTVTNHAFPIGKGAGQTGFTSLLCGSAQLAVGQSAADPICQTITGDITLSAAGATTIGATKVTSAMLNADVFSTAHTWAGQQTFVAPVLGTPASGTLTNTTGFPIANLAGAGTGVLTFLATPSSANLRAALTDEVGTGSAYFVGGALGTPASATLTNATGLPVAGIASVAANTILGNFTTSSAVPTATDPSTLTTKASPAAGDYIILSDQAASGQLKKATVSSVASAGSVSSLNGSTGSIVTDLSALQNCSLAVSAAASALTVALKDAAGSDPAAGSPCAVNFRNATGTTGTYSTLSVTAATSLVVSSGSTLGVTSSTAFRIWVVLFNDAGTARLGVINASTGSSTASTIYPVNEGSLASSTAEGGAGAADSAGVFYTGTAVSSKPYRVLGFLEWSSSGLTAGTWTTTNLILVQSYGQGVKLPGEVVQSVFSQTASTTVTTSSTFGITALTGTLVPTSAANIMRIRISSTGLQTVATAGPIMTIGRGGACTTVIGSVNSTQDNTSAAQIGALSPMATDKPNTTSSLTYNGCLRSNVNTNSVTGNISASETMLIEEIQG